MVSTPLAITEDEYIATGLLDAIRPKWALYIGGMGAKGRNFYHDLVCRYGFKATATTCSTTAAGAAPASSHPAPMSSPWASIFSCLRSPNSSPAGTYPAPDAIHSFACSAPWPGPTPSPHAARTPPGWSSSSTSATTAGGSGPATRPWPGVI
ncbi:MAG: hypothetical protein DLM60_14825 [Pseudonocardiales bacterium]|nr:MAG: hypothetical protein DLM60_14825 [Pseudonocardiales bacterium]